MFRSITTSSRRRPKMGVKCFLLEPVPGVEYTWRRVDNGEVIGYLSSAPPGAMWDADWYRDEGSGAFTGPDGLSLVVKCPDGRTWFIDGQCANCTTKDDYLQLEHHCWTRTGAAPN